MIKKLKAYLALVRLSVKSSFVFAGQFWGNILSGWIGLFLTYYLWLAVYGARNELAGISLAQMVTYLVVSAAVTGSLRNGPLSYIGESFHSGQLFELFIKPLSFPLQVLTPMIGQSIVFTVLRGLPVLLFGIIFFGVKLPPAAVIPVFLFSMLLSFTLCFLVEFIFAQFIFLIKGVEGIRHLWQIMIALTSGALVPMQFLPDALKGLVFFMPFHCIYYTPINIYLGGGLEQSPVALGLAGMYITPAGAALLEQFLWVLILFPAAAFSWNFAKKRIMVFGG